MSIDEHAYIKNGELILPMDYELTEGEQIRIHKANIRVKYTDKAGRLFLKENNDFIALHPLRQSKNKEGALDFSAFSQFQTIKAYTALSAKENIFKGDIQIKFRGELDDCLAHILFLYSLSTEEKAKKWLYALRSILGNVMAASCTDTLIEPFEIDGLSADEIHAYSHNPLKHIGHDHIVPSFEHGDECNRINTLRTKIRLAEVSAYTIYANNDGITRPDILYALNRLSSACYVLMIMLVYAQKAKA